MKSYGNVNYYNYDEAYDQKPRKQFHSSNYTNLSCEKGPIQLCYNTQPNWEGGTNESIGEAMQNYIFSRP